MVPPDREVRNMKRDVPSGILLIAGALTGMLVMSLHPTAHDYFEPGASEHVALLNMIVHGLALAALPAVFLGLLGLTRRLASSDLAVAALVVYGFACVAITTAAIASGFVFTDVAERMTDAAGASRDIFHELLTYTGILNQAFAKVNVVASSVAILLWSMAILKSRLMSRVIGNAGLIVGGALLVAFFAGHLRLNVHGFGIVVFLQGVWLIWIGVLMCHLRVASAG